MGIKGLWQCISKKYAYLNKLVPQTSFKGKRVAFDANNWLFIMRSAIRSGEIRRTNVLEDTINEHKVDQLWLAEILRRLLSFMNYGITPVLVFDGPSPIQKTKTKLKRTNDKDKALSELEEVNREIEAAGSSKRRIFADMDSLLKRKQNAMCKLNYIPSDSMKLAMAFFRGIGIPVIEATQEGERLGAALCRDGVVAALYSSDGDSLTHGCPILIRDVGVDKLNTKKRMVPTFELVYYTDTLDSLGVSEEQFTDLCIMAGCDYNENMPGISFVKSHGLIKKYGGIDQLPKQYDTSCLIHHECRELFSRLGHREMLVNPDVSFDVKPFSDATWEHFDEYEMTVYADKSKRIIDALPTPRNHRHLISIDAGGDFAIIDGDFLDGVSEVEERSQTVRRRSSAVRKQAFNASLAPTGVVDGDFIIEAEKPAAKSRTKWRKTTGSDDEKPVGHVMKTKGTGKARYQNISPIIYTRKDVKPKDKTWDFEID